MDKPQRGEAVIYISAAGVKIKARIKEMWPRSWMANLVLEDGHELHGIHRDDGTGRPSTWTKE